MPKLGPKAPKAAKNKRMHEEMHKFKHGLLKSSSGQKVTKRSQAIAIGLSESGQSKKDSNRKKRNKGRH